MTTLPNKKISAELLERYFKSPPGFRLEVRNISNGWALDGKFAIPLKMVNKPNFARISIEKRHPLERMSLAISNGFMSKKLTTELVDQDNWVYCISPDGEALNSKYAWLFNQIDDNFLTSVFPCWIPGDIEKMVLSALTLFYQYSEVPFSADDHDSHKYKIAVSSQPKSDTIIVAPEIHYVMITDEEGETLLCGEGRDLVVAIYDLYEKAWLLQWRSEAPTITELKDVIDIQNKDGSRVILMESASGLESEYLFYNIGKSIEYSDIHCYSGRFKFLEGEFEVFERPLYGDSWNRETKRKYGYTYNPVASVDKLLELISGGKLSY